MSQAWRSRWVASTTGHLRALLLVGWLVLSPLCASAPTSATAQTPTPTPAEPKTPDSSHIIGPGDTLEVLMWPNTDRWVPVPVRPDGKVSTPFSHQGDVVAVGKTPPQLARDMEKVLSQQYLRAPRVNIIVAAATPRAVSLWQVVAARQLLEQQIAEYKRQAAELRGHDNDLDELERLGLQIHEAWVALDNRDINPDVIVARRTLEELRNRRDELLEKVRGSKEEEARVLMFDELAQRQRILEVQNSELEASQRELQELKECQHYAPDNQLHRVDRAHLAPPCPAGRLILVEHAD